MQTSPKGRAFIEEFEGLFLHAYNDGVGVCTIGYGHTDSAGPPKVHYGDMITKEQADAYLAVDLSKVEHEVLGLVHVPLTQNQFDALVSFHFNTGALGRSTLLKLLNSGAYTRVPAELMKYNRGGGAAMKGLTRRRKGEGDMWLLNDHASTTSLVPSPVVRSNETQVSQVPHTDSLLLRVLATLGHILLSLIQKDHTK